ncbi:hypothetical protein EV193_101901 [Herbihabitans rhizosphaerae]|uniref:Uncharacterized protein n=1 Tax=Herbihabitans rhizosphaerae TaxID=1872711 RepID=A0A4Q7L6N8_9PSEU|nr:hypothetical protein [Herbihabitans rhizosphaerae]RZS45017.1 hypothetical protein EV193_101901 [Herbihabitans rhizosphaerae]
MRSDEWRSSVRMYLPWPEPVRAARYGDPGALGTMVAWVESLRQAGHVGSRVRFSVQRCGGVRVGVLEDGKRVDVLRPKGFLVFDGKGLRVLGEVEFWRNYHTAE